MTSTTTANLDEPRTYGYFKPARRRVFGGLGPGGVIACLVVVLVAFVALIQGGLLAAAVVLAVGGGIVVPFSWEIGGYSAASRILRRLAFQRAAAGRQTMYRSGVVSPQRGSHRLPGILYNSEVYEVETGRAGWPAVGIVVVNVRGDRFYAATLRCHPPGVTMVDQRTINDWVGGWAAWLEKLDDEPGLVQAQVTVETSPDPGGDLARAVARLRSDNPPALADQVMAQVVSEYPHAAARVDTRITLTYMQVGQRRSDEDMCKYIATRLPSLMMGLTQAGAGAVITPLSAADLAIVCKRAYSPYKEADIDAAGPRAAQIIDWANAGPESQEDHSTYFQHDGAFSATWVISEAPRSVLYDTAFTNLAAPDLIPGLLRKRLTLLLQPLPPGRAARIVDQGVRDAQFRVARKMRPNPRDLHDLEAANVSAQEEATGAGLVDWSLLYTVTAQSREDLDELTNRIRDTSAAVRLRMHLARDWQAAAFATTLPGPIVPSRMATIR